MDFNRILEVSSHFDVGAEITGIVLCDNGNINHTYFITAAGTQYVLQKVNTYVFKKPVELIANIRGVTSFLQKKIISRGGEWKREALTLIPTQDGEYYFDESTCGNGKTGFWRMYYFIEDSVVYQSAEKPGVLFEAAKTFGMFQRMLDSYPADTLFETIPYFHDTAHRYEDFEAAVKADAAGRVKETKEEIEKLREFAPLASKVTKMLASGELPLRVTHNDTKLNNILMDKDSGKGLCVIDLDTVMPGSLLYDFGDNVRFAACNTAEDDPDLDKVYLRLDLFREITEGFVEGIGDALTKKEKELLPFSAFLLTYELALRFMGDYLAGDVYFKLRYPGHNLVRARAQLKLARDIYSKLDKMTEIVNGIK